MIHVPNEKTLNKLQFECLLKSKTQITFSCSLTLANLSITQLVLHDLFPHTFILRPAPNTVYWFENHRLQS